MVHDDQDNVQAIVTMGGTVHGTGVNGIIDTLRKMPQPFQGIINKGVRILVGPAQTEQ